jgi:maltose O-acetyltransferase
MHGSSLLLYPPRICIHAVRSLSRLSTLLYLKLILKRCGDRVSIGRPFVLFGAKQVEIGNNVFIGAYLHLHGAGGVRIGDRVMIASHVAITSVTHDHSAPMMYETDVTRPVIIGDDSWIGTHSVILPGVTIGNGAVIGAGSVVRHNVPPNSIAAGVPARIVRQNRLADIG